MAFDHDPLQDEILSLREFLRSEQEKNERLETRLKKREQVLDHYRQAVDNSPNAIFSINRNGHITTWNPACEAVFDYDASILGSHVGRLLFDRDQVDFIENEILRGSEVKTYSNLDFVYTCRNGETREMVSRIYPVENEKGVVHGFVFANTDVTERNRIHRELDRYRHHLEELVDERTVKLKDEIQQRIRAQRGIQASYDAMMTLLDSLDLAIRVVSLEHGEIIFQNNRLKDILAKGERTAENYHLFDMIRIDSGEIGASCRDENDKEQTSSRFDPVTGRWFLITDRVITWVDGRKVRLQVATDITERKQIDEERQRVEKLESLGVLAGGIAHDFNNLLTGIMGSLSLLQYQAESGNPNYALLDSAVKASSRATSLTQQLLTFSKGGDPVRSVIALEDVLREAVTFSLHGSAVKSTICLDGDLYHVEADGGQLSQVFHNLAINAKQVMEDGGVLAVSAVNYSHPKQPGINDLPPGKYVRIDFTDSGPGIAPEIIDKIFDPYFTTKAKGEGLGLAMVHTIIAKHGGRITAEPNPDCGVTFRIFLPASDQLAATPPVAITEGPESFGRVLLMDDEEAIRQVGEAILVHLGYSVVTAADGEALLARYQEALATDAAYDAVILDLTIPGGMGGEEVARRLARMNPAVKVIASSGYSDSPVMADCSRFGFSAILKKPYMVEEMSQVLQKILQR